MSNGFPLPKERRLSSHTYEWLDLSEVERRVT
jgi:hypothetical protein